MQNKELIITQIKRGKKILNVEKDDLDVNELNVIRSISNNEIELISNTFLIGYFRGFRKNFTEKEDKLFDLKKIYLNLMMVRVALTEQGSDFFKEDIELVLQFIEDNLRSIHKYFENELNL